MKYYLPLAPLVILSSLSAASAQEKYYVWTYPYETSEANQFELESNSCLFTPSLSECKHTLVQHFELEYGVTDRFQLGFCQVFIREYPSGRLSAESFIIEGLYKLAQKNKWAVNPLLYLEYERDWNLKSPNCAEAKLALSKDFGLLNGTFNGIAQYEFGAGSDITSKIIAGISYELIEGLRAGIEALVTLSDEREAEDEDPGGIGIGPTVSVATPWFDIASGATFGITGNSNAVNFCANIGFEL